jgi:hypothetical protein
MNENIVGNIEEDPTPISATPHHKPVSDELPKLTIVLQNNDHCNYFHYFYKGHYYLFINFFSSEEFSSKSIFT